ncbi:hypothetical protein D3C77_756340 [compost metagenome]
MSLINCDMKKAPNGNANQIKMIGHSVLPSPSTRISVIYPMTPTCDGTIIVITIK